MPRLKVVVDEQQLRENELREGFSLLASDDNTVELVKAIGHLLVNGDLGFWLSPRLMRKLKAFATEQQQASSKGMGEIDDKLFLSWLQQGGNMEPDLRWEVESLPDNGSIYKILLEGGKG